MRFSKAGSKNFFIGVFLAIMMLLLVSLTGSASNSANPFLGIETSTPTIDVSLSQTRTQNYSPLLDQATHFLISTSLPHSAHTIYTNVLTDTLTPTPTSTSTPTFTPSPSITPTQTPTPQSTSVMYLPLLSNKHLVPTYTPTPTHTPPPTPLSPAKILFCDDLTQPEYIPDDDPNGINNDIIINDERLVVSLNLYLNISHTWVGDLRVTLTNQSTGKRISVLDRPGAPRSQLGCRVPNIVTILDDSAIQPAEDKCALYAPAISGIYQPNELLSTFSGKSISGSWRLNVSDHYPNDTGKLNHWCMEAILSDAMPPPTPTPTPVSLPSSAYVDGMSGQDQQYTLDCESRSAVDWAKHFGFNIDELDFLSNLPDSDDPEAGFVGNPRGTWGNIPPDDYGAHAPPIAELLRDYGITANSYRSLQWDDLRAEIASGNPAIVWIIGGSWRNLVNGIPQYYTAQSTGKTTIVASGEHTVVVVGYSPSDVTILNGSKFIVVPLEQFLDSWSVLEFMAVLTRP